MIRRYILLIFFIFQSDTALAYSSLTALKGGVSMGVSNIDGRLGAHNTRLTAGLNTHLGYRFTSWEFNASSYINFATTRNLQFFNNGSAIKGKGLFRSVAFGPTAKYIHSVPIWENRWHPYLLFGPIVALHSFKIKEAEVRGGSFKEGNKLTYESIGAILALGSEEILDKSHHPTFIEFAYKFLISKRRSEVGGSKKEVLTLNHSIDKYTVNEHSFLLSIGILIF